MSDATLAELRAKAHEALRKWCEADGRKRHILEDVADREPPHDDDEPEPLL